MLLTDAELARLSYPSNEKLWTKLHLRMDGPMNDAVRKLAQVDHRVDEKTSGLRKTESKGEKK